MTTAEQDNITRVGPATMMGQLMRQYWIPAALSAELVADGEPLRLMILGEKLVAFRDTNGRVGIMDHRCPHRCASLFLGRNEAGGLRCIYHGWKFDTAGNCLDVPSVPGQLDFKEKIRAKAYRTAERNGLIWVYMGERAQPPALPQIEATLVANSEIWMLSVNAPGSRRSRGISTPRTSGSCTSARLCRRNSTKTIQCALRS